MSICKTFPAYKYEELRVFQDDKDAKVVLMRHKNKQREFVVKIIDSSKVESYVDGISFEAYMGMKVIDNEGFAKTRRFFITQKTHYLVIEFIQGTIFRKFLEESEEDLLPLENFQTLARSYFQAMAYLAEKRIYPRGLHERNFIVQSDYTVKIIDFEQYLLIPVDPLTMGQIIVRNIRPLFPLVDGNIKSFEKVVDKYNDGDGYEDLSQWINEVLSHLS